MLISKDSPSVELLNAPRETDLEIVSLIGGRSMIQRLSALGLTQYATVKILKGGGSGPMIVEVRGSRVGIGRGISCRIIVRPFISGKVRAG